MLSAADESPSSRNRQGPGRRPHGRFTQSCSWAPSTASATQEGSRLFFEAFYLQGRRFLTHRWLRGSSGYKSVTVSKLTHL